MKVYKTDKYPDEATFLQLVADYREYINKRRAGEVVRIRTFPRKVMKYGEILEQAQRSGEEPEALNFIDLTKEEHQAVLDQAAAAEAREKAEKAALDQRAADMAKSITDPQFRELFLRQELYAAGHTIERIIWDFVLADNYEVYFDEIKAAKLDLENEIRQLATDTGETYVES